MSVLSGVGLVTVVRADDAFHLLPFTGLGDRSSALKKSSFFMLGPVGKRF